MTWRLLPLCVVRNAVRDMTPVALVCLSGMLYLTASAWDEAVKKEQLKVKEIEDKYNGKILEHGVRK